MANEIDLFNDLKIIEDILKDVDDPKEKKLLLAEYRKTAMKIKDLYPDLKLAS